MSEPKLISPLLDNFAVGGPISNHDGVSCYPAMREGSDEKYILKIITIPASQVKLEALLLTGAYPNAEEARKYFESLVNDVENEAQVLHHLAKLEGFLAYDEYQVVPMEESEGVGFHVYLLSPYKRSLAKFFANQPMTHLGAVNLGIDLCAAMSVCRQVGCLYIDLKPENIFISDDGKYRVGDLGFIPRSSLKYASLPEKYRSSWTAPEVEDAWSSLSSSMDIYAIGLILYQAYNNGQLPFESSAPKDVLPPPMYADYEMADIILKACAPNPEDRWQDPKQLGQALVAYMQRNGANDTPIVPPVIPVAQTTFEPESTGEMPDLSGVEPDIASEQLDQEVAESLQQVFSEAEEQPAAEETEPVEKESSDTPDELAFISALVSDETAPSEENGTELENAVLTDELTDMLAQADELLSHETPAPVVSPEPIDVPMPEPIVLEPEVTTDESTVEDPGTVEQPVDGIDEFADGEPAADETPEDNKSDTSFEEDEEEEEPRKSHKGLIGWLITLLILAGLVVGGYFFYTEYYLQEIDQLTLQGSENILTVNVDTDADESLLTVTCTDTYGGVLTSDVVNGVASFDELKADSQYTVQVKIDGFHKLSGMITSTYSTPPETEVLNFAAIAGSEDGSAILSFTVSGAESDAWTISYIAEGEETKSVSFAGHTVTISGLTVDKEYTFTILPSADMYLVGNTELKYTAAKVVFAENLVITGCSSDELTVEWTAPADTNIETWTVRCYNEAGYDVTLTTETCSAVFTDIDTSTANTVEVMAGGMTQCTRTFITSNPVTIDNVRNNQNDPNVMEFTWDFSGETPDGGWMLVYTIDDGETEEFVQCDDNSASLSPVIPGAVYHFTIQAANGVTIFNNTFDVSAAKAENFSGFGVTNENMEFSMCATPDVEDWNLYDLTDEDYMTAFKSGDKASFLVHMNDVYNAEYEDIVTLFVIRDSKGKLVSANSTTNLWVEMWNMGYCELDIPELPGEAGTYTVEIYFNGAYVTTQSFTME